MGARVTRIQQRATETTSGRGLEALPGRDAVCGS